MQKQTSNENYGQISYSGKNALKILDWLYVDSAESNRLERKYQRYIEAKQNNNLEAAGSYSSQYRIIS